ncbi:MAG: adenine phosphoribosyltransferase [Calditrichaceae bacterium]|nr:adenine phosphoribosyltransferase [Calditrichaceae bacterium]
MEIIELVREGIRDIPDFPQKGIIFKDITTLLNDPELFIMTMSLFEKSVKGMDIDYIAGIESRGFIFGSILAYHLGCGFVPIRKPGKLPAKTFSESYALEYGTDSVEIHQDAFKEDARVLIIDDLLATGGTALAAAKLVEKCGARVTGIHFLIELLFLKGAEKLKSYPVESFIKF